jgi:SAM-dependent methyltransferase
VSIAPDGSPVELYALLPERGEGELVVAAVPPPAAVLELGCGVGRVTRQLVELGYVVTAVDESPEMLSHVCDAETVRARIEGLDLGRRFDVVLLASNLLSTDPVQRRAFLETCVRHSNTVVIETLPLGWEPREVESRLGEVVSRLRIDHVDDGVAHGEMEYEAAGRTWRHPFAMRVFADEAELGNVLAEARLELDRWLDRGRGWFLAKPRDLVSDELERDV